MKTQISIRLPDQMIEDLRLLSGDGKYQPYMIDLLSKAIKSEFDSACARIAKENEVLRSHIKKIENQIKCNHTWLGKSENQYCSKCGLDG